ncbi:hypothetical protein [Priestia aryabhattai]|uniref:hypothetical protein n=1 Tax=Priestia aryabhattai TaxID=412384 RepID=UPI00210A9D7D|nr:hypothetical protein [Priestia aryabhattai]
MRGTGLTKEILIRLYTKLGKSDKEIAEFFDLDRTTIVHNRKKLGIETRKNTGQIGETLVFSKLTQRGFKVQDMNKRDKTYLYDLKVNGHIRIEVKTSKMIESCFNFSLSNKKEAKCIPSEHRIVTPTGRTAKLYRKTCDFIIFVGLAPTKIHYYIVPSSFIEDGKQSICFSVNSKHKYKQFENQWKLIRGEDNAAAN